jgi:hypothetical protein
MYIHGEALGSSSRSARESTSCPSSATTTGRVHVLRPVCSLHAYLEGRSETRPEACSYMGRLSMAASEDAATRAKGLDKGDNRTGALWTMLNRIPAPLHLQLQKKESSSQIRFDAVLCES